jgi:ubiquinone/menaquinone biosynthesis C-methylase UbiE
MPRDALRETQAFFGGRAEAYRQSRSHGNREDLDRMVRWLAPRPGARALDVATGGGHTALALQDAGCRVVALDATAQMLSGLAGSGLGLVMGDAQRLPFRDGSLDVVASRIAPHHFPDLPAFCAEAARVLRPGGALYVFDLTSPADQHAAALVNRLETLRDPSHVWSHSLPRWRSALDGAPLHVERLEETSSTFALEPWIARAAMPPERDEEARRILREHPASTLGGYGLVDAATMRVLRVELLARKP